MIKWCKLKCNIVYEMKCKNESGNDWYNVTIIDKFEVCNYVGCKMLLWIWIILLQWNIKTE